MGLLLSIVVHSAGIQDRNGAEEVLKPELKKLYPRMKVVFADAGYKGKHVGTLCEVLGWELSVVERNARQGAWKKKGDTPPIKKGFEVLKWRWIVERTFAWLGRSRRLSKEYERLESSSRNWILLAMSQLMIRRLA